MINAKHATFQVTIVSHVQKENSYTMANAFHHVELLVKDMEHPMVKLVKSATSIIVYHMMKHANALNVQKVSM